MRCLCLMVVVLLTDHPLQKRKRYVQDLIREKASLVHDLICKRGGTIFVCG